MLLKPIAIAGAAAAKPPGTVQQTNEELQEKARLLAEQNPRSGTQNQEVEQRAGTGRQSQAAGAYLSQIGVLGEYVARVAHAA